MTPRRNGRHDDSARSGTLRCDPRRENTTTTTCTCAAPARATPISPANRFTSSADAVVSLALGRRAELRGDLDRVGRRRAWRSDPSYRFADGERGQRAGGAWRFVNANRSKTRPISRTPTTPTATSSRPPLRPCPRTTATRVDAQRASFVLSSSQRSQGGREGLMHSASESLRGDLRNDDWFRLRRRRRVLLGNAELSLRGVPWDYENPTRSSGSLRRLTQCLGILRRPREESNLRPTV